MQPFAITLMTCEGVPMIWQGQEFGEIYGKHDHGGSRVLAARPLHWNYFYEESGRTLANLYRKLGKLRKEHAALTSRYSFYFYLESDPDHGLVAFLRKSSEESVTDQILVIANFSNVDREIVLPLDKGSWKEVLTPSHSEEFTLDQQGSISISAPSNYGKIFAQTMN